jgi:hypothetical protein
MGSLVIILGFGAMLGKLIADSGAAHRSPNHSSASRASNASNGQWPFPVSSSASPCSMVPASWCSCLSYSQ